MTKIWSVALKSIRELVREPLLLGLLFFFPTALVGFYRIAFGQTEAGLSTYLRVVVVNEDMGPAGHDLAVLMTDLTWEGDPVFDVQVLDERALARSLLRERKAGLLVHIPATFSVDVQAAIAGGAPPASVTLEGHPGTDTYAFARSFFQGLLRGYVTQRSGEQAPPLTIDYEFLPGTGTMSDFDFGVGGIIVFGVMFLVISTATVLVRENVWGTLQRLRLSRAGSGALLLGTTLGQLLVAAIQIPITFGAAVAMGFENNGSLVLAMVIGLLLSLSAVGLGLVVACIARNDGDAANLGSAVLVPAVFLSGALFPMPQAPLFTIGTQVIEVYDFIPATPASEALRQVLVFGAGPGAILYELCMMTVVSLLLLALGVVLYRRLRMNGL